MPLSLSGGVRLPKARRHRRSARRAIPILLMQLKQKTAPMMRRPILEDFDVNLSADAAVENEAPTDEEWRSLSAKSWRAPRALLA